jgi:hypothetical protein
MAHPPPVGDEFPTLSINGPCDGNFGLNDWEQKLREHGIDDDDFVLLSGPPEVQEPSDDRPLFDPDEQPEVEQLPDVALPNLFDLSGADGFQGQPNSDAPDRPKKRYKPKGTGPDSLPDSRDNYDHESGHFSKAIRSMAGPLRNTVIFKIVDYIAKALGLARSVGRFGKRRLGPAYCWMDENRSLISRELLGEAIRAAKATIGEKASAARIIPQNPFGE